jgi:hypothetical protein
MATLVGVTRYLADVVDVFDFGSGLYHADPPKAWRSVLDSGTEDFAQPEELTDRHA